MRGSTVATTVPSSAARSSPSRMPHVAVFLLETSLMKGAYVNVSASPQREQSAGVVVGDDGAGRDPAPAGLPGDAGHLEGPDERQLGLNPLVGEPHLAPLYVKPDLFAAGIPAFHAPPDPRRLFDDRVLPH